MFQHGEEVVWHRWLSGGIDEYGGQRPGTRVDQTLTGVGFSPEGTAEDTPDGRVTTQAELVISGSSIQYSAKDQFTVRGVRYGVEGTSAGGWRNPFTGWSPGQTIKLTRVTGV